MKDASKLPKDFCIDLKQEKNHQNIREFKDWFSEWTKKTDWEFDKRYYGRANGKIIAKDYNPPKIYTIREIFKVMFHKRTEAEINISFKAMTEVIITEMLRTDKYDLPIPIVCTHYIVAQRLMSFVSRRMIELKLKKEQLWPNVVYNGKEFIYELNQAHASEDNIRILFWKHIKKGVPVLYFSFSLGKNYIHKNHYGNIRKRKDENKKTTA